MAGITITFRPARSSDRAVYDWKPYGINQLRPTVCTVNGKIALIYTNEVVYRDGEVADLVRALRFVHSAIAARWEQMQDDEQERQRRRFEETMERLRES